MPSRRTISRDFRQADFGRIRGGHHDRAHALGTERVDGDGQRQRRIDTSRQADDRAREAVLAEVVTHAENQRLIDLGFDARRRDNGPGLWLAVDDVDHRQRFLELRQLAAERSLRVENEGAAVEDQFVLAAGQVGVDHRQAGAGDTLAKDLGTPLAFADVIGRSVEDQQNLGAGLAGKIGGAGFPDVGADIDAAAHALERQHARAFAGIEIAFFVEHLVARQTLLVVGGDARTIADQCRGVVAALAAPFRMSDEDGDSFELGGQGVELGRAGGTEILAQQEVFRRVAAERQFRRQQQIGALRPGAFGKVEDARRVAGEIADRGVDLGNGNLERHGREHQRKGRLRAP
jgi:hypothetical protein